MTTHFRIIVGASLGLLGACASSHSRPTVAVVGERSCTARVQPRLHLERMLTSQAGIDVARNGLVSLAPWRDQGMVVFVAGRSDRVWVVDSLGNATPVPVPDSVWANYPDINRLLSTPSGHIVLWEGLSGKAVLLRSDGQLEGVYQVAQPTTASPVAAIGPDSDLYLELDPQGGPQRIIRVPWPLGSAPADTLIMPDAREGRKFASAQSNGFVINQRVPFHPEPAWGPLADGAIGWSSGARYDLHEVTHSSSRPLLCDPGDQRAPISKAEREENEAVITWMNRYTDPDWEYQGPRVPEVHPAIVGIGSDWSGRVLITVPAESRELSSTEVWSLNAEDPLAPRRHFEQQWEVHRYSREGEPLGFFALPPQVDPAFAVISGKSVWGLRVEMWSREVELVRYRVRSGR